MSDTEERENSPVSKEEEDVKKEESDIDEDESHGDSDEPSPTKSESSTAAVNESLNKSPSPKKKKQPAKKDEEQEEEDGEEESEEESDGEPKLGLLERPVVIESGKRQKKKVERLDISGNATPKEKKQIEFDGAGLKLGDCPRIELQIQKNKADDLKVLHKYLFGLRGATNTVKKNLRNFNGFSFEKDDKEYEKKTAVLIKYTMTMLRQLCAILDLERQGSKEQVIERLMTFCMAPKDSGKKVPKPKRKRGPRAKKETGVKRKRASKKEMEERRKNAEKAQEEDDEDDDEDDDDVESAEDSDEKEEEDKESEKSESDEEESEEEEAPKKKKRKIETPKKKSPTEAKAKKPAAKKETKKPKVTPKKVAAPVVSDSDSEDSDDSDDEPLQKKAKPKPSPPTNDDLKTVIKKILDKANLEEVTMKSVIKEVYEKYPAFDLSDRKDYIKKTVKQLIT
ncbi:protein DEK-like [Pecten maximus]|uniref:protein DEK-like n=1 Tax=Pecten maximus TaxID=6579 RepID=UPI001458B827|nr:protein DEK-like [Pecten maximus]